MATSEITACGLIPVAVIDDATFVVDTANALMLGGINTIEITLRTEEGLKAIAIASEMCPDIIVGAGTVRSIEDCRQALRQGAKFVVSPGFDPDIVSYCVDRDIPVYPGCVTPSEIFMALKAGLHTVKFFPAHIYGGAEALRALQGPFPEIRFIPTGGIDPDSLSQYLLPNVIAVSGSWLCPRELINKKEFGMITSLCKKSVIRFGNQKQISI